jgi:hypothetical protein
LVWQQQIATLRELGAQQADPLCLHYLEVLSARAQAQQGRVKGILQDKLALAVSDFQLRLTQVQSPLDGYVAPKGVPPPKRESLGDLVRYMAQQATEKLEAGTNETVSHGPELKSVRLFRNTWSKLSADKQLNQALEQAPKNAGPINSHMLVLRSLALMRELSPDYLNRFFSYADTLVRLEQADKTKVTLSKTQAEGDRSQKPKARLARRC